MYAIISSGSKQFKVAQGDVVDVELLAAEIGSTVSFDALMTGGDGETKIGAPVVKGVKVTAKVLEHGKAPKIVVFKYKSKKNERKKQGHRQPFTKLEIVSIG